jgi:hypothetical protein
VFFFAIAEVIKISRTHFLRASIGHHGRIHFAIRQSKPVDVGAVSRLWIATGEQSGLLTRIATVNASLCERMKS